MILSYTGDNFKDFMKGLGRLVGETKFHTKNLSEQDSEIALIFISILEYPITAYKNKVFQNLDFSQLEFQKKFAHYLPRYFGYSSITVNDIITGSYNLSNPNPLLEMVIISFFVDFYELELSNLNQEIPIEILTFNQGVLTNIHLFSDENLRLITKISLIVPNICMKKYATNDNMTKIQTIGKNNDEIAKSLEQVEQLKQEIQTLKTYLETQKHEYNFVGLSNGFQTIQESKKGELDKETRNYHILFGAIIAVSVIKFCWLINNINEIDNMKLLGITIGVIMFLFILLYFFRITLLNIKSIKSQLLQIDLRLTLCQFIANYGAEIEKVNEKSRESFESVIFSPIVPTESQIPATFEGIDQLTSLIGIINKDKT